MKKIVLNKDVLLRELRSYLIITLGLSLYAFGWISILTPAEVVGGGAAGWSLLVYHATGGAVGGIPIGISFLVFNGFLIGIACFVIGPRFGAKTLYAIGVASILMSLIQEYVPSNIMGLADDTLLSAILGAALSGIGVAMCLTQGGSTGGTDIIAMIVNKYKNYSYGRVITVCDTITIGLSYFIFGRIDAIVYGYVTVLVFSYTVDAILAGNKQSTQVFIISDHYEELADQIAEHISRGVTILDGMGWYTKQPRKVIMVVCRKTETSRLYRIIKEKDPNAFITAGSVMGVYGNGFEVLRL